MKGFSFSSKSFQIIFIFLALFSIVNAFRNVDASEGEIPIIDGLITENEWSDGDKKTISMADGSVIDATLLFNETHVFVFLQIFDDDPTLFESDETWDVFGLEFDVNGDQVPMGMYSSPDDALFVSYGQNGGEDFILQGMGNSAREDTSVGGSNDVIGVVSINNSFLRVEACKKLDSGDKKGADISLHQGSQFYVMYAYWDNRDPHIQSTSHSNWISYTVPGSLDESNNILLQTIVEGVFIASFVFIAIVLRFFTGKKAELEYH
jgi:hypothetical protein